MLLKIPCSKHAELLNSTDWLFSLVHLRPKAVYSSNFNLMRLLLYYPTDIALGYLPFRNIAQVQWFNICFWKENIFSYNNLSHYLFVGSWSKFSANLVHVEEIIPFGALEMCYKIVFDLNR